MEKFSEHGTNVEILEKELLGEKFKGMREFKPFVLEDKLFINLEDGLYRLVNYIITDDEGNMLKLEESNIDTNIALRCIYVAENQTVVIKRSKKGHNFHIFPGGHIMYGESDKEALIRELKEEVGIDVDYANIELIEKVDRDEYGIVKFYIVRNGTHQKLLEINPDEEAKDENTPMWIDIEKLGELENLYPENILEMISKKLLPNSK